jgi:6-pyruvoyltetrahydropterin/6-carboxytetrahydropterin synthase
MFEVSVEKTIACAHRLFDYNGPCEELHGHNYRVVVTYHGQALDRYGMLVDFGDIKKALNAVLDTLDHKYLNDLVAFADLSPSAENIAAYIFGELKKAGFERGRLAAVSVWETPTQVATYREEG